MQYLYWSQRMGIRLLANLTKRSLKVKYSLTRNENVDK